MYDYAKVAVRGIVHERMKAEADRRGMKLTDLYGEAVQGYLDPSPSSDPLGDFLRAVLDADYSVWFEVGPQGWEVADLDALPPEARRFVQEAEPTGDGRHRVKLISKDWALRVAAENVLGK